MIAIATRFTPFLGGIVAADGMHEWVDQTKTQKDPMENYGGRGDCALCSGGTINVASSAGYGKRSEKSR